MRAIPIVAVMLLGVSSAEAQFQSFWTQCAPGALRACVSVDVALVYHPAGTLHPSIQTTTTELRITLGNPQGQPGYDTGPRGFRFANIRGFESPSGIASAFNIARHSTEGNVTQVDNPMDNPWSQYEADGSFSARLSYDYNGYLFGCDLLQNYQPWAGYDATCKGRVTYSMFILNDALALGDNMALDLYWNTWAPGGSEDDWTGAVACTTGVDCVTVTPEPGTIILLGSGLAGLAGAMRRRRRH